jgi:molybdopterin-guanine dinucleotide biosynthesis protein A
MNHGRLAGAILAGGAARRMGGKHKALLTVGNQTIVERQLAALRQVANPVFIVAPDPAPFAHLDLAVVADRHAGWGALGGIYTAIWQAFGVPMW